MADTGKIVSLIKSIFGKELADVKTAIHQIDTDKYEKPSAGIPASDLATAVQTSLGKAETAYQKPSGGIPSTDMTSAVRESLAKADTALQGEDVSSAVDTWLDENIINPDSPPLDRSLSSSSAAAPADIVGKINDKLPPITTKQAYNHLNLIDPTKITFIGDSKAIGTMKFANRENLAPDMGRKTSTNRGVTYTTNGYFLELDGTCNETGGNYFLQNAKIKECPAGTYKVIAFVEYGDSTFVGTWGKIALYYLAGGNTVVNGEYVYQDAHTFTFTADSAFDTIGINVQVFNGNKYDGYRVWFGLYPSDVVVTDTSETVSPESTYDHVIANNAGLTDISTMTHYSTVYTGVTGDKHIDIKLETKASYVTPEEYGAVGDGAADDYEAISAAITEGIKSGKIVLCAQKYLSSQPIVVDSNAYVIIKNLIYTGQNEAVRIHGRDIYFEAHQITSNGIGLTLTGDATSGYITGNRIVIGTMTAGKDGIVLNSSVFEIFGNSIDFRDIGAGGNSYYCIKTGTYVRYITENIFRGGHCHNAHYAVKGVGGNSRFENFYVEDNIKGGFFNCAPCTVINDRHFECCLNSDEPFIKFEYDPTRQYVTGELTIKYISNINLPFNKIDVAGVGKTYDSGTKTIASDNGIGIIDCPIGPWTDDDGSTYAMANPMSHKAYLFGDAVIFTPIGEGVSKNVQSDFDMSTLTKTSGPLPSTFIVDTADVAINLHSSYCWIGYSKFVVSQKNGYTAKVYEWFGNQCVFDGTSLGDGDYEVECYTDAQIVFADGTNMKWRYRKLNNEWTTTV